MKPVLTQSCLILITIFAAACGGSGPEDGSPLDPRFPNGDGSSSCVGNKCTEDNDRDGFTLAEGDCNDKDASIHPEADEVTYDGVDNDCDSKTRDDDLDRDGADLLDDCDDEDPDRSYLNEEILGDGIDNDCRKSTPDTGGIILGPQVDEINPESGNSERAVSIIGSQFEEGTTVFFGGREWRSRPSDVNELSGFPPCIPDNGGEVLVDIEIYNPQSELSTIVENAFTYTDTSCFDTAPVIDSIRPNNGVIAVGTTATVRGRNFIDPIRAGSSSAGTQIRIGKVGMALQPANPIVTYDVEGDGIDEIDFTVPNLDSQCTQIPCALEVEVCNIDRCDRHLGFTYTRELGCGVDPNDPDDDDDGLSDADECTIHLTSPVKADSDGDGWTDFEEVNGGSNPLDILEGTMRIIGDHSTSVQTRDTFTAPYYTYKDVTSFFTLEMESGMDTTSVRLKTVNGSCHLGATSSSEIPGRIRRQVSCSASFVYGSPHWVYANGEGSRNTIEGVRSFQFKENLVFIPGKILTFP